MSAPSLLHEQRVAVLSTLADLSGYTLDVSLDTRRYPDVTRLHRSAARLLVADAKASEHAGDVATRLRLINYALSCRPWLAAGFEVNLMVCHDRDRDDSWSKCLSGVAMSAALLTGMPSRRQIDASTWVTSLRVGSLTSS